MEETATNTKITIVLSLILATLLSPPTLAYSNGGYSADPSDPDYGTHDWIAQHALDWLPDNGAAPDGIGDSFKHHVYYYSNGDLQDDISALRARTERNAVIDRLGSGEDALAAKHAGIMSHYVVDLAKSLGRKA